MVVTQGGRKRIALPFPATMGWHSHDNGPRLNVFQYNCPPADDGAPSNSYAMAQGRPHADVHLILQPGSAGKTSARRDPYVVANHPIVFDNGASTAPGHAPDPIQTCCSGDCCVADTFKADNEKGSSLLC